VFYVYVDVDVDEAAFAGAFLAARFLKIRCFAGAAA